VYAVILATVTLLTVFGIATRVPIGLDVLRDRNQLYREVDAGVLENVYTLRILNMDTSARRFVLRLHGIVAAIEFDLPGIEAEAGAVLSIPVRVRAQESALANRSTPFEFELATVDPPHHVVRRDARFIGPAP
jgi:polyferredoxin